MVDLLIEIQTEEFPANYLVYGNLNNQKLFRDAFQKAFDQINESNAYAFQELKIYLTPRRLVFACGSVNSDESEREEILFGPPADKAYDSNGNPTKVLQGFMNSKNASIQDMEVVDYKGRSCVACKRMVKPKPFEKNIQVLLDEIIRTLNFPKFMWWDDSGFKFPRPVRGLMCLYRDKNIGARLGSVDSTQTTMIFRNGDRRKISVESAAQYFEEMRKAGIVLDQQERKQMIQTSIQKLADSVASRPSGQKELLDEVVFLTEAPVCLLGEYADSFSDLPKEVLTSSLSKSQRLFELLHQNNNSNTPYFVMVLDGSVTDNEVVLKNVASILTAKLQDSHFFFEEDSKIYSDPERLKALHNDLNNLVYLKGVGSVGEKSLRVENVIQKMKSETVFADLDLVSLSTAAHYAKVDLLTQIVGEFPELQGIAGGIYLADKAGCGNLVGEIVASHYQPMTVNAKVPEKKEAAMLSLLDKLDLVVACFAVGKKPTASQDPYGLKRNMAVIYKICETHEFNLNTTTLFQYFVENIATHFADLNIESTQVVDSLRTFHKERLQNYFENQYPQYDREAISAVLEVVAEKPWLADKRLKALNEMKAEESMVAAAQIVERTSNILKNIEVEKLPSIRESLLTEVPEQALFSALNENQKEIISYIEEDRYQEATRLYAKAFSAILSQFFDQVLVNVDDSNTRLNRLALLMQIRNLYAHRVADLSKIKTDRLVADSTS